MGGTAFIYIVAGFIIAAVSIVLIAFFLRRSIQNTVNSLKGSLEEKINSSQNNFISSQQAFNSSLKSIYESLTEVSERSRVLLESSRSFENIFRSPSPRGGAGEVFLENIIKDILPKERFQFQYSFKNGKIADAVIFFSEGIVALDSKFSTEAFERFVSSQDERDKNKAKREFLSALKKKIDETSKYILPEEKTFDFAFMYLPAESIFYEAVNHPDIMNFARSKKVFITGPNTIYAYLKTVMVGFEGLRIQEEAKRILESMHRLEIDLVNVKDSFSVLGSHLKNASARFDDTDKDLNSVLVNLKSLFSKGADEDKS